MEIKKKEIVESIDTGLLFLDTKSHVQINSIIQRGSSSARLDECGNMLSAQISVFDQKLGRVEIDITAKTPHEIKNLETLIDSIQQLNKG